MPTMSLQNSYTHICPGCSLNILNEAVYDASEQQTAMLAQASSATSRSMPNFGTHAYLFLQQSSDRAEALPTYASCHSCKYHHCREIRWTDGRSGFDVLTGRVVMICNIAWPRQFHWNTRDRTETTQPLPAKVNWLRKRRLREDILKYDSRTQINILLASPAVCHDPGVTRKAFSRVLDGA